MTRYLAGIEADQAPPHPVVAYLSAEFRSVRKLGTTR